MRVAWFSPMPPVRSGIAACSDQLVPSLRAQPDIRAVDVFVDEPVAAANPAVRSAHEFLWRHRATPYDLNVYQLGNSSHHDYLWPYLFRFPGVTVLHDPHLHHARAAALLRRRRYADYRAEFAGNHPDSPADAAELAIAGFDSHLYYMWPMTRLVVQASRLTAVHTRAMADRLQADLGIHRIDCIRLSQGTPVSQARAREARRAVRARYGIAGDAVTYGCFGGLTPDKRLPQILDAFRAIKVYVPNARLMFGGQAAQHDDLVADVRSRGLEREVVIAGYLQNDEELSDCIAAADVTLNLRWPTARELSGPWLRALAAGKPSIIIDVLQLIDVPSLDPRTWSSGGSARDREPVAVAIDILDEDHSLRLAMKRLGEDADLRRTLGAAAQSYWLREHSPEAMLADYLRVMAAARLMPTPPPSPVVPKHLVDSGTRHLEGLLAPFGVAAPFRITG